MDPLTDIQLTDLRGFLEKGPAHWNRVHTTCFAGWKLNTKTKWLKTQGFQFFRSDDNEIMVRNGSGTTTGFSKKDQKDHNTPSSRTLAHPKPSWNDVVQKAGRGDNDWKEDSSEWSTRSWKESKPRASQTHSLRSTAPVFEPRSGSNNYVALNPKPKEPTAQPRAASINMTQGIIVRSILKYIKKEFVLLILVKKKFSKLFARILSST